MVLLFLIRSQGVPPFTQDLAYRPIILMWVTLMNASSVSLAEYHKSIHGASNMFLVFSLQGNFKADNWSKQMRESQINFCTMRSATT